MLDPSLPGFVIIGQEDWDSVWRRNQFLMAGLARRCPATRFLFVELPCDLTYGLRTGQFFRAGSATWRKVGALRRGLRRAPGFPNIFVLTPPKILPDALPAGETGNARLQAWVIRRALARLGIRRPIFWTQNPFAAPLLGRLNERAVIYDVTDDWTALAGAGPRFVARAAAGDAALTARADCVITCSDYLYEQKRPAAAHTVLIPNGVKLEHYAQIGEPDAPAAPCLAGIPRPRLGYTGSLHAARLDLDLICALAVARPAIQQVYVGPIMLTPIEQARLRRFANIHLLGPAPYVDLPAIMTGFDALMIPHQISRFTESLNPLKLFEYLAAGLPVVTTAVAGARDYADLFAVAATPAEFIAGADTALAGRATYDRARARRLASAAQWDRRVGQVLEAIGRASAPRPAAPPARRGALSGVQERSL